MLIIDQCPIRSQALPTSTSSRFFTQLQANESSVIFVNILANTIGFCICLTAVG